MLLHRFSMGTIATLIIAAFVTSSCAAPRPVVRDTVPAARAWIATDPAAVLADFAPLPSAPAVPPTPDGKTLALWHNPPTRWMSMERTLVAREWVSPTRAARCYALLAAGINDALLVADAARATGVAVSDDAVIASVSARVISYNHPLLAEVAQQEAATARWMGVWASTTTPEAVEAGEQIGQLVAQQIITWAQQDGAETFVTFTDPAPAPGVWQRTPPRLWSALDPGWGNVRPIGLDSVSSLIAVPPPAWDSAAFAQDRAVFATTQQAITDTDRATVKKWAAGMGSMTPAGMWLEIADTLVEKNNLSTHHSAALYATLAVAMHDAFITCWSSKFQYLVERPITWMHETDGTWKSVIDTPPFPSYPSGHATVSGTASTVLSAYFPDDTAQLSAWADEAAHSRVVGGIHWPLDSTAGLAQGQRIGTWIVTNAAPTTTLAMTP